MNEGSVLIHIWTVNPAQEAAAVRSLDEMFGQIATDPGFVSARILESADRASLAAIVEMTRLTLRAQQTSSPGASS
jgi:hypothetical protein